MKKEQVVSFLLVAAIISTCQAATLDTSLLQRYICQSRDDGSRFMMPGSCNIYYQCLNGRAQVNRCPAFYDALSQQCVNKNPGCVETVREPLSCQGPCCGVSDGGYAVDTKDPAVYYLCKNNCVAEKKVCANGQMFDLVKLECSSPSTCSDCTTHKPPCETTTCEPPTTPCPVTTVKTSPKPETPCTTKTTPCATETTPRTTETTPCTTKTTPRTTKTTPRTTKTTPRTTATTPRTTTTCSTRTTCTTTTTTCTTTTTTCTTTTTTCTTTTTTCTTTTTTCTTTTPSTTTTSCTTTTPCTTTTSCTTTTCTPVTTKAPCNQTTTTTCTTTKAPCTTTKAPCKQSVDNEYINNALTDPFKYVLPSKLSYEEIEAYTRSSCINKPEGFMLPSLRRCNEYFICRNNIALPVSCGMKYFNIDTNSCDLPNNTGCIQADML